MKNANKMNHGNDINDEVNMIDISNMAPGKKRTKKNISNMA